MLKKEINQNVPFISEQYEFILGQQIVLAAKELKLECCVIKGLYVSDFMPGFVKKDESLHRTYELNDYEIELIKLLKIEDISKEKLEQMIVLHREKKGEIKEKFKKPNDTQNSDEAQVLENQTQSKTQYDKYIIKVYKKVLFSFAF